MEISEVVKAFAVVVTMCIVVTGFNITKNAVIQSHENYLTEKARFCGNSGGYPVEPSRESHFEMLCIFEYNTTEGPRWTDFAISEIKNEGVAEILGREVGDLCFSCWDKRGCASPYNEVLRRRGLHC